MTKLKDSKARLLKDPEVRKHYDAMEEEFAPMAAVAKARALGVEPSTRTLDRFPKATGHRLKVGFEPVRKKG